MHSFLVKLISRLVPGAWFPPNSEAAFEFALWSAHFGTLNSSQDASILLLTWLSSSQWTSKWEVLCWMQHSKASIYTPRVAIVDAQTFTKSFQMALEQSTYLTFLFGTGRYSHESWRKIRLTDIFSVRLFAFEQDKRFPCPKLNWIFINIISWNLPLQSLIYTQKACSWQSHSWYSWK